VNEDRFLIECSGFGILVLAPFWASCWGCSFSEVPLPGPLFHLERNRRSWRSVILYSGSCEGQEKYFKLFMNILGWNNTLFLQRKIKYRPRVSWVFAGSCPNYSAPSTSTPSSKSTPTPWSPHLLSNII
jgi:hypothetical protein